jgi:hypothetical protein
VSDRPIVQIIADLATDPPEWWPMSKSEAHTVVAALLDAYRERDEWRATARIEREERTKAEREAAQLRETLGWVEQWADSGNDNHLSLLLTVRAALAASRGDQSSRS